MAGAIWIILFVQCKARIWHLQFNKCSRPQACSSWLLVPGKPAVCWGSRLLSGSGPAARLLACKCQAAPPKQGLEPHSSSKKHHRLPFLLSGAGTHGLTLQAFFLSLPTHNCRFLQDRSCKASVWPSLLIPGAAKFGMAARLGSPKMPLGSHHSSLWMAPFPPVLT